jgi:hypothetical protein
MLTIMKTILNSASRRLEAIGMLLMVLCWPAAAWAQAVGAPPQPKLTKVPQVWVGLLIMFALLVVVVGISLMPSRRGHQD